MAQSRSSQGAQARLNVQTRSSSSSAGILTTQPAGPAQNRLVRPEWRQTNLSKTLQDIGCSGLSVAHYRKEGTSDPACALAPLADVRG